MALNPDEQVPVRVVVHHVPEFLKDSAAGVALFAAETGADLQWIPLASCTAVAGEITFDTTTSVTGPLTITLARDRKHARHGYLAKTTNPTTRRRGPGQTSELDASAQQVQLRIEASSPGVGPLQLTRVGDPAWQASDAAPTGVSCDAQQDTVLVLGAGDYELSDPLEPTRRQRFSVPTTAPVTIHEPLVQPPTRRS